MEIFTPTFTFVLTAVFAIVIGFLHFMKERQIWNTDILNLWEWLVITTTPLPLSFAMIIYEKIPVYWFFVAYFSTFLIWIIIGMYNRKDLEYDIRKDYDFWIIFYVLIFLYCGMVFFQLIQSIDILEIRGNCYFFETAKEWTINVQHCK